MIAFAHAPRSPSPAEGRVLCTGRTALTTGCRCNSHIHIAPSGKMKPIAVREIKARQIGQLITLRGMVVRCTDVVRPFALLVPSRLVPGFPLCTSSADTLAAGGYSPDVLDEQRPLMTVAAYTCEQCGYELYQPVENKSFMPLQTCQGPMCATNRVNGECEAETPRVSERLR